jgi:hypothetical protein
MIRGSIPVAEFVSARMSRALKVLEALGNDYS